MGQYHLTVNLDKKQYLDPHKFGDGLKLMEFGNSMGGTLTGLTILLASACKGGARGGGDIRYEGPLGDLIGSWAGDRIAIVGDYSEPGDIPGVTDADFGTWTSDSGDTYPRDIYNEVRDAYEDISEKVREIVASDGWVFYTTGWGGISRVESWGKDAGKDWQGNPIDPSQIVAGKFPEPRV